MKPRRIVATALLLSVVASWGMGEPRLGAVTNQPLPRWVSMKADEANARRGPSMNHRIDWVFRHRNMPLLVTAEHGHWRRVEDRDGVGGWIHYILLSRTRTVVVDPQHVDLPGLDLHRSPSESSDITARAEPGAIAFLNSCKAEWCEVSAPGARGWAPRAALWGADLPK